MSQFRHYLIGQTITAEVFKVSESGCDCYIWYEAVQVDGVIGRLSWLDTFAWKPHHALSIKYISDFQIGKKFQALVLSAKASTSHHSTLLYLHERRANESLSINALTLEDEVCGWVRREIPNKGWIVQLDCSRELLNRDAVQPDVTVLATLEHLPSKVDGLKHDLYLEPGDFVIGTVHRLAHEFYEDYQISLKASLGRWDTYLYNSSDKPEPKALWHWHRMLNPQIQLENKPEHFCENLEQVCFNQQQRLLLVEDDETTLKTRSASLRTHGASIEAYHACPSLSLEQINQGLLEKIEAYQPHLVLLDYACPNTERGLKIAEQFLLQLKNFKNNAKPIVALCGSVITPQDHHEILRRLPDIQGVLLRPLRLPSLLRLLSGERFIDELTCLCLPEWSTQEDNLNEWIRHLYQREQLSGLLIGQQTSRQQIKWLVDLTHGIFQNLLSINVKELYRTTRLRSLLDADTQKLELEQVYTIQSPSLLNPLNQHAIWWRFEQGSQVWIVAVASAHPFSASDLLKDALRDGLLYRKMQQRLVLHAELLSSGLLLQSLTHEFYNRIASWRTQIDDLEYIAKHPDKLSSLTKIAQANRDETDELENLVAGIMMGFAQRAQPTNLRDLFRRLERVSLLFSKEFSHRIYLVKPPTLLVSIPASIISLALINLMHNTGKHDNRSHGLQQRIYWDIKFSVSCKASVLQLIIEDNGLGISGFNVERLFQPGESQAEDSSVKHGIGLWLSRMLLRRFQGDLYLAESAVGRGCRFIIELPLLVEMED